MPKVETFNFFIFALLRKCAKVIFFVKSTNSISLNVTLAGIYQLTLTCDA
jgi:hypothetical protein